MAFECLELDSAIKMYAAWIANDIPSQRVELHSRICELLDVDYQDFKPFESIDIKKLPTEKEALKIIQDCLAELKTQGKIKGDLNV